MNANDLLLGADQIACRLIRDAIWDGKRCNWTTSDWNNDPQSNTPGYHVSGSTLYDGSSGIGCFLAAAHAELGDRRFADASIAAFRQASSALTNCNAPRPVGFYSGRSGVCAASTEASATLGSDELFAIAEEVGRTLHDPNPELDGFDLVTGSAGAIIGLLHLFRWSNADSYLQSALAHARALLDGAVRSDAGWSWPTPGIVIGDGRNLTGISHGASGIAWALLELDRVASNSSFRSAAQEALRYEDSCFDVVSGNWPDYRRSVGDGQAPKLRFATTWCHGAPGIVLARRRIGALLNETATSSEVVKGMRTTIDAVIAAKRDPSDYSLCHGMFGNLNTIMSASDVGCIDWQSAQAEAEDALSVAVHRHVYCDRPWPCGTSHGLYSPGLMCGVAGIGYFLLRAATRVPVFFPCLPAVPTARP